MSYESVRRRRCAYTAPTRTIINTPRITMRKSHHSTLAVAVSSPLDVETSTIAVVVVEPRSVHTRSLVDVGDIVSI